MIILILNTTNTNTMIILITNTNTNTNSPLLHCFNSSITSNSKISTENREQRTEETMKMKINVQLSYQVFSIINIRYHMIINEITIIIYYTLIV
jgi:hypothetical protein